MSFARRLSTVGKFRAPTVRNRHTKKIISYSDYDHYNHANNTKYADLLMDAFSVDELIDKWVKKFRISYIKQCKCGEKLLFYKSQLPEGGWVAECRKGGELRAQLHVEFGQL